MEHWGGPLYCRRCREVVRVDWPARGWTFAFRLWVAGLFVALLFSPIIASDWCIMLPSLMLYLSAGGVLRRYAIEKPTCLVCSLELDPERRESPVSLVPSAPREVADTRAE